MRDFAQSAALVGTPDISEEERDLAAERAQIFFATDAPPEIADAVATLRDGPEDGDLARIPQAAQDLSEYVEAACDDVDPDLLRPATEPV